MERLYSPEVMKHLSQVSVTIVGIGGVGSWAAECLARSGIGHLRLIDLDEVCSTNINRQVHALDSTIGKLKVEVMAQRIGQFAPQCEVEAIPSFLTVSNCAHLLASQGDFLIDAIDATREKAHLLHFCHAQTLPVVSCGAAGGKKNIAAIQSDDLGHVHGDRLLAAVRRRLRKHYGFTQLPSQKNKKKKMGIPCIFSPESPTLPPTTTCNTTPTRSINCTTGYGSALHMTASFGLWASYYCLSTLCSL